jgi:cell wall-associated NlpC family hydrolase
MTVGSHRARLGARSTRSRRRQRAPVFVLALIAEQLLRGPSTALAQDTNPPSEAAGGTVRARAVDGDAGKDVSSADGANVSTVAARELPAAEPPPSPPATGEAVATFALRYVGYPYAWVGNTPAGFDCSGFAEFVVLNTLGIDTGHDLGGQPAAGSSVAYGAWQPGDLVFFQNTYQSGLSHAGIDVGDGLFVHAENEGTGVVVTSITSDYYAARYSGAVRVD